MAQQLDFTPLARLEQVFEEAQNKRTLADIGKGLADGTMDYKTAAGQIASTGNLGATYQFLQLAEAKDKQAKELAASGAFNAAIGGVFGGGGSAPSASPTIPTSAAPQRMSNVAPGKIYDNNEPSPLDPPSGLDRDRLARTVLAEVAIKARPA